MKYHDLSVDAKQRACASAKLRYARRRDERRREDYLKVLPRSRCPRLETLRQYGLFYAPEGWVDEEGTLVVERVSSALT